METWVWLTSVISHTSFIYIGLSSVLLLEYCSTLCAVQCRLLLTFSSMGSRNCDNSSHNCQSGLRYSSTSTYTFICDVRVFREDKFDSCTLQDSNFRLHKANEWDAEIQAFTIISPRYPLSSQHSVPKRKGSSRLVRSSLCLSAGRSLNL